MWDIRWSPIVRFLSWALHIFAFDLAYEPEGWPWKPVSKKLPWNKNAITRNLIHLYGCIHSAQIKSVVVGFHELLVTVPASPGDLMAQVSDDVNHLDVNRIQRLFSKPFRPIQTIPCFVSHRLASTFPCLPALPGYWNPHMARHLRPQPHFLDPSQH